MDNRFKYMRCIIRLNKILMYLYILLGMTGMILSVYDTSGDNHTRKRRIFGISGFINLTNFFIYCSGKNILWGLIGIFLLQISIFMIIIYNLYDIDNINQMEICFSYIGVNILMGGLQILNVCLLCCRNSLEERQTSLPTPYFDNESPLLSS